VEEADERPRKKPRRDEPDEDEAERPRKKRRTDSDEDDEGDRRHKKHAKADGEGMANLYADDALLMPPGAPAQTGRAAIKTFLGEDSAKTRAAGLAIKNGNVTGAEVSGDTGWISGNYTVVDASGAAVDSGSYLSVHRRTNGVWLYTRDIWNSDRAPAPAPAPK